MATKGINQIVRTWGSALATTKAFFIDLPNLTRWAVKSDQMSELEKARIDRDVIRTLDGHYPYMKNYGALPQWRNPR